MLRVSAILIALALAGEARAYPCDLVQAFVASHTAAELIAIGKARGGTYAECSSVRACLTADQKPKINCEALRAKAKPQASRKRAPKRADLPPVVHAAPLPEPAAAAPGPRDEVPRVVAPTPEPPPRIEPPREPVPRADPPSVPATPAPERPAIDSPNPTVVVITKPKGPSMFETVKSVFTGLSWSSLILLVLAAIYVLKYGWPAALKLAAKLAGWWNAGVADVKAVNAALAGDVAILKNDVEAIKTHLGLVAPAQPAQPSAH
jgi:hypothetical protein